MKLLTALMYTYQYALYQMIEWDKHIWKGYSKSWMVPTEIKAIIVFNAVEIWSALALYAFVNQIILGRPIHIPTSIIFWVAFGSVMTFLNYSILGPVSRTRRYQKIFDSWDKKKQVRWNVCLISFVTVSFTSCLLAAMENAKMLHSK